MCHRPTDAKVSGNEHGRSSRFLRCRTEANANGQATAFALAVGKPRRWHRRQPPLVRSSAARSLHAGRRGAAGGNANAAARGRERYGERMLWRTERHAAASEGYKSKPPLLKRLLLYCQHNSICVPKEEALALALRAAVALPEHRQAFLNSRLVIAFCFCFSFLPSLGEEGRRRQGRTNHKIKIAETIMNKVSKGLLRLPSPSAPACFFFALATGVPFRTNKG